ncbi:integrase [Hydrogenibacillus schlegelii]|uniref:IS607 family transposase n=1 Tax=Hydrogenibacillus schlegelii TaxID=1484 RepID=UPI000793B2C6|nr:IS607 family transposase [Hydrogenibacillus schlegelii]KWX06720.1 integrase [Hydrogenibacillus schlegelii]
MKLSEWARKRGITYKTAWRWVKEGKMPVPFEITPSGTILVHEPEAPSSDQKADLERQVVRLLEFANAQGLSVGKTVKEIGSGLNGKRRELIKLLSDPNVTTIVVEHRDRLTPVGFEFLEAALRAQGRRVLVVEEEEKENADDLVRDMTEVLTSLAARWYGKRSARRRAKRALEALQREDP